MKKSIGLIAFITVVLLPVCIMASSVMLSWKPPLTNTDGTLLIDLKGHRIYRGLLSGMYTFATEAKKCVGCPNPTGNETETYCVSLLPSSTYYFAISAYNTLNNDSVYSTEVVKTTGPATYPIGNIDTVSSGSVNRVDGYDMYALLSKLNLSIDSFCNETDFPIWKAGGDRADLNHDGQVGPDDFVILAANFSKTG